MTGLTDAPFYIRQLADRIGPMQPRIHDHFFNRTARRICRRGQ
jgi:hypothetical protein